MSGLRPALEIPAPSFSTGPAGIARGLRPGAFICKYGRALRGGVGGNADPIQRIFGGCPAFLSSGKIKQPGSAWNRVPGLTLGSGAGDDPAGFAGESRSRVGNPLGAASWGFGAENFVTFPLPRLQLATLNGGHVSALSGCCAGGGFWEGRDWWVSTPAGVLVGENWGSPRAEPRFRIGGWEGTESKRVSLHRQPQLPIPPWQKKTSGTGPQFPALASSCQGCFVPLTV